MKIFIAGVSCVGKTSIGACLAGRLGCAFYDLDTEIETHFGRPIARLRAETLTPRSFRSECATVVLKKLIGVAPESGFVMALMPSGLMDSLWGAVKKTDRVVVVLRDSAENILSRLRFYDAESRPILKVLTDEDRSLYLRAIKEDMAYFGRTFHRGDITVDIHGLDVERSAAKIQDLLRKRDVVGAQ